MAYSKGVIITAAVCSVKYIAIGTMQRWITIYDQSTYQQIEIFHTEEPVMYLALGESRKFVASAGTKSLKVWSIESSALVSWIPIPARCISLTFFNDDSFLLAALRNNELIYWDLLNKTQEAVRWTTDPDISDPLDSLMPTTASINNEHSLLAIAYRAYDILVWNFGEEMLLDHYCRETGSRIGADPSKLRKSTVLALAFSSAPDSSSLVAGYADGKLVLYDIEVGGVRHAVPDVNAQTLCSSPDGQTLATGDRGGTIRIFDLESLRFLYRISFDAEFIAVRSLIFTAESHRLLDIRGRQCRIWEPPALLRQEADDAHGDALSVSAAPQEVEFQDPMNFVYITAMASGQSGDWVLCGKDDGSVHLYGVTMGVHMQHLFSHAVPITTILFDDRAGIMVTADQSSRVVCHRLIIHPRSKWHLDMIMDSHVGGAIRQVVGNQDLSKILVSTVEEDILLQLGNNMTQQPVRLSWPQGRRWFAWMTHPAASHEKLVYLTEGVAVAYTWESLSRLEDESISFERLPSTSSTSDDLRIRPLTPSDYFITISEDLIRRHTETQLWPSSALQHVSNQATPVSAFGQVAHEVEHVLGVFSQRLVFFHTSGWVCSIPLPPSSPAAADMTRHFFIPADWHSLNSKAMIDVTQQGDVIFARRSELAVIRRGFELERKSLGGRSHSSSSSLESRAALAVDFAVSMSRRNGSTATVEGCAVFWVWMQHGRQSQAEPLRRLPFRLKSPPGPVSGTDGRIQPPPGQHSAI
ncbi:WD40-repeat-containing domain protein [Xylariomycetidae sp. FL2044]|nr:WD40-repeat-containing domain protein [Xylariomycetidae sp. FL2044]